MTRRHSNRDMYFTCLLPPDSVRARFNALAAAAPQGAEVKKAADLHITLNFLQVPRKRSFADLVDRLAAIEAPAFKIKLLGMDSFYRIPRRNVNDHVVWLRPDGASGWAIRDLHARILLGLRPVGYHVGQNEVTPHMTALNYPFHAAAEPLRDYINAHNSVRMPTWQCNEFHLCRRIPLADPRHPVKTGGGSKYEILGTFKLK